jgi:predicted nucleotidyltransferase
VGLVQELMERQQARASWLESAVDDWADDERVVGAWLWGSEGTGTADALSDYDLFVALADDSAREELEAVERRFPRYGDVVWARESRYNAPSGGRYFSVGYPAPLVPLGVDWYWQPASYVEVGSDTRVLVEKRPLTRVAAATFQLFPNVRTNTPYRHPDDPKERLEGRLRWFWSMYGALSKWAARGQDDWVASELPRLGEVVEQAAQHVDGRSEVLTGGEDVLVGLRYLATEMERLHPLLENATVTVPATEPAWAWLVLAKQLRAARWMNVLTSEQSEAAPTRSRRTRRG